LDCERGEKQEKALYRKAKQFGYKLEKMNADRKPDAERK
jgi:hypothetical protein